MWETFWIVFSTMLGLLVCLSIGYILRRFHLEPNNAATVLSKLVLYVLLPAMVLHSFIKNCIIASLQQHGSLFFYGLIVTAATLLFGKLLSRFFSKESYERKIYTYALSVANFSYIGVSVVVSLFGSEGLYAFNIFCVPLNMLVYGYLVPNLVPEGEGDPKGNWLKRILNPITVALLLGLFLGVTGLSRYIPGFLMDTMNSLSGCVGPVAMILTGFVIGGFHIPDLLRIKKVYVVAFLRLLVLPMVLVALVWLLRGDKTACLMTMITYASALGLNTVVIPATHGGDTHTGASMAIISSVACVVTIPLLYAFLDMIL
ncbi:MAG: AEC family transporter [Oscillospiraceae bacterium]|nr:AEC family transporter [Oscillospiraceae bacterium]